MNAIRLALSVRRFDDYDPFELCSVIEHWAANNNGRVKVTIQDTLRDESGGTADLIFMTVEYDNYPTQGNRIIEIKQFIRSAAETFNGISFSGVNIA